MGRRENLAFIALSIFFSSIPVLSHPLDSTLGEENVVGSWKNEIPISNAEAPGPTVVLAENRTKRPDILSRFHKYRGAAAFIVSVLWFISFGLALVVHYFCGWKLSLRGKESSWSLRICLLLLAIFTTAAAIGCILLSLGQYEFHREALDTLNYVINQSDYTVQTLRNVTEYLLLAKTVNVAQIVLPSDVKDDIDRLNLDLNSAADTLEQKTHENSSQIRKVFNAVRSALIIVAVLILLISILGLVLSILGHQHTIHIFVISGWLLVAVTFILCGVFVILNNTIADTCMAMGEWVENPHAETALTDILPCIDQRTTNQTLFKSKQVIIDLVNIVNGFVNSVANSIPPPQAPPSYYNQSGPFIPQLCYPYNSNLQDRPCSPQELHMENASLVWENYTCTISANGVCSSAGRLTPDMYTQLVGAVNVSFALQHYTPPLLSLQNCDFVRDAFRKITSGYCRPLGRYLRTVNAGLGMISIGVMPSLALWILYANRPQREEVFAKLSWRVRGSCSGKSVINVLSTGFTPRIGV